MNSSCGKLALLQSSSVRAWSQLFQSLRHIGLDLCSVCRYFSCINPVVLSMRRVLGHRDAKFSPAHGTLADLWPSAAHCLLLVLHCLAPVVQAGEGQRSPRDAAAGGAATTLAFVSNCMSSLPGYFSPANHWFPSLSPTRWVLPPWFCLQIGVLPPSLYQPSSLVTSLPQDQASADSTSGSRQLTIPPYSVDEKRFA